MVRYARRPLPEDGQDDHGPHDTSDDASPGDAEAEADRVSVLTY